MTTEEMLKSAGPLDIRPGLAQVEKSIPQPVKDVVGAIARPIGKRVAAASATMVEPFLRHGTADRGLVQLGGEPFDPLAAVRRVFYEAPRALITGQTPEGVAPTTAELLRERGFNESPISQPLAEGVNSQFGGFPIGSLARWATSPEGAGAALEMETGVPLANAAGTAALLPAGKAVATVARRTPGIKQAMEFKQPGSSLPGQYREPFQDLLRTAEGEADLRAFIRNKQFGEFSQAPLPVQDRIQTAIETRNIGSLVPAEQKIANDLVSEFAAQVGQRTGQELRPWELAQGTAPGKTDIAFGGSRVATQKARESIFKRKGMARYSSEPLVAGPGGLGTGRMAERTANRQLTTEALNSQIEQATGIRPFEPVGRATLAAGSANDARVMHAQIIKGLVDQFGKPAQQGEATIADLTGVPTGFSDVMKAKLKTTALPKELHETLDNLNKRFAPRELNRISGFMDQMNRQFKTWALFSPGFVSRNVQNNMIQTAIFGNTDVSNWADAFSLRRALGQAKSLDDLSAIPVKIGKQTMTGKQYVESAIKRGVVGRGQAAQETSSLLTGSSKLNPIAALRNANTFAEDVSRMSFDLHGLRSGLSPIQAARKVDHVLFNYSPRFQSPGFAAMRRGAVPFINWTANIPQLAARTVIERPGSFGMIGNLRERQNQSLGLTPETLPFLGPDVVEQGGTALQKMPDGTWKVLEPQGYGTFDVNAILGSANPQELANEAASRTYPQYSLAYALATNRDPLSGREFTGAAATAPAMLKSLWLIPGGKDFAAKQGIFIDQDGTVKAPDKLAFYLRSFPPQRLGSVIADLVSPGKNSDTRIQSFLTGVRTVTRGTDIGETIQARKERDAEKARRKAAATYPEGVGPNR